MSKIYIFTQILQWNTLSGKNYTAENNLHHRRSSLQLSSHEKARNLNYDWGLVTDSQRVTSAFAILAMCTWTVYDHLQKKCKPSHSKALCSLSKSETKCQTSKFFCKILSWEQLQIVHLRSDNRWRGCGAVLLSCNPAVIVTAAHCLEGVEDPAKLRVNVTLEAIL